jgi:hypothetical protein
MIVSSDKRPVMAVDATQRGDNRYQGALRIPRQTLPGGR